MSIEEDVHLLALCMWREARGEGEEGLRAVAHVIRNRHIAWALNWIGVIMQPNQFTSMSHLGDPQLDRYPDETSDSYQRIKEIAERVYAGEDDDLTGGALYYYNPRTSNSPWFVKHVVQVMTKTATIGQHEFFRP